MRTPLTPRRSWPKGETITPLPPRLADVQGFITIYASREVWPVSAQISVALEFLDTDDGQWKPAVGFIATGGVAFDLSGQVATESFAGTAKRDPITNNRLGFFRSVWPTSETDPVPLRLPPLRLRVDTNEPINSLIEVDW